MKTEDFPKLDLKAKNQLKRSLYKTSQSYDGSDQETPNYLEFRLQEKLKKENEEPSDFHFSANESSTNDFLYAPNQHYILKKGSVFYEFEQTIVLYSYYYNSELRSFEKAFFCLSKDNEPTIFKLPNDYTSAQILNHSYDAKGNLSLMLGVESKENSKTIKQIYNYSQEENAVKLIHTFTKDHKDAIGQYFRSGEEQYVLATDAFVKNISISDEAYTNTHFFQVSNDLQLSHLPPMINSSGILPLDILLNEQNSQYVISKIQQECEKNEYKFEVVFDTLGTHLLIKPTDMTIHDHRNVFLGATINLMDLLKAYSENTLSDVSSYLSVLNLKKEESEFFKPIHSSKPKVFSADCQVLDRTFVLNFVEKSPVNTIVPCLKKIVYCNDDQVQSVVLEHTQVKSELKKDYKVPYPEYGSQFGNVFLQNLNKKRMFFKDARSLKVQLIESVKCSEPTSYSPYKYRIKNEDLEKSPYYSKFYKKILNSKQHDKDKNDKNDFVSQYAVPNTHFKTDLTTFHMQPGAFWRVWCENSYLQYYIFRQSDELYNFKESEETIIDPSICWNVDKYSKYTNEEFVEKIPTFSEMIGSIGSTETNSQQDASQLAEVAPVIQPSISSFRKR